LLRSSGKLAETDIVIANGRLRAGYHIGSALAPDAIVHIIGERPGTGLDAVSAYLTYGRSAEGLPRWKVDLDHSCTTAICGIHPKGKPPETAAEEIAACVARMLQKQCSGVLLRQS
jgi:ethanolamine ammonia-lyase large subunit